MSPPRRAPKRRAPKQPAGPAVDSEPVEPEVVEPEVEAAEPSEADIAAAEAEESGVATKQAKALAPLRQTGGRDALQQYMSEVNRYPLLTREQELPHPDQRARLDHMPGSGIPVIHQQWDASDPLPFWAGRRFSGNHLYDVEADPEETRNLAGSPLEAGYRDRLRASLESVEAPAGQFDRLRLSWKAN